jgi:hypothetical protein
MRRFFACCTEWATAGTKSAPLYLSQLVHAANGRASLLSGNALLVELKERVLRPSCWWCPAAESLPLTVTISLLLGLITAFVPLLLRLHHGVSAFSESTTENVVQKMYIFAATVYATTIYSFFVEGSFFSVAWYVTEKSFTAMTDATAAAGMGLPHLNLSLANHLSVWIRLREGLHTWQRMFQAKHNDKLLMYVLFGVGLAIYLLSAFARGQSVDLAEPGQLLFVFSLLVLISIIAPQLVRALLINKFRVRQLRTLRIERNTLSQAHFDECIRMQGGVAFDLATTLHARRTLLENHIETLTFDDDQFRIAMLVISTGLVVSILSSMGTAFFAAVWNYASQTRDANVAVDDIYSECRETVAEITQCSERFFFP